MQNNILWIFVVAAFGVCHCHDSTDDDSTYDSSLSEEEGRCNGSPYNPRGLLRQNGWFYDQNRDECRLYYFGDGSWYKDKNKFQTLEECRKTCRSGVPSFCFEKPEEGKRTQSFLMYSYDAKQGVCVDISASTDASNSNVFRNGKRCNSTCRDPELGKCAPSELKDCSGQESDSYHFDVNSQTCRKAEKGKCGPFTSLAACSQRCGRYIPKKCHVPALSSRYCNIQEKRYWYNSTNNKCEEILGCQDDVTSFPTAKDCWLTCSSEESSRCLKRPDLGKVRFGSKRYYYNLDKNTCDTTTFVAFWQKTSNKNHFKTLKECTEMCKHKYDGVVKKL
uniref:Putative salivary kunitz domain protein n=1 Tax=Ixodes ricinus TaxID=34613 RepID=A0A0K8RFY5_IXORI